jgi:hypothetical protein
MRKYDPGFSGLPYELISLAATNPTDVAISKDPLVDLLCELCCIRRLCGYRAIAAR